MLKKLILTTTIILTASTSFAAINTNITGGTSTNYIEDNDRYITNNRTNNYSKSNDSTASGGNSNATGGKSKSSSVTGDSLSASNNYVNLAGDSYIARRNTVATAYAPALISGIDTCTGSITAGGQAATFGLSFGKTLLDKDCVVRKDARLLHNMGYKHAAVHLLCQKKDILQAMYDSGEKECRNMYNVSSVQVVAKCEYPNQVNCEK